MFYPRDSYPGVYQYFRALEDAFDGTYGQLGRMTSAKIAELRNDGVKSFRMSRDGEFVLSVPLPNPAINRGRTEISLTKSGTRWKFKVCDVFTDLNGHVVSKNERMTASIENEYFYITKFNRGFNNVCNGRYIHSSNDRIGFEMHYRSEDHAGGKVTPGRIENGHKMVQELAGKLGIFVNSLGLRRIDLPDFEKSFEKVQTTKNTGIIQRLFGR